MKTQNEMVIMSIYLSSTDRFHGSLLYEAITIEAKNFGIDGATVFHGQMGFGASSRLKSDKFWEMVSKVPVVIELIDDRKKLERFAYRVKSWFEEVQKGFLITISPVEILLSKEDILPPGQEI